MSGGRRRRTGGAGEAARQRTQRAFFRQMVAAAGWRLDWSGLDPRDNVNRLRSNGVDALTILMDEQAYASYEKYGAWTDQRGQSIPCSPRKLLPYLGGAERAMYERLTDPDWEARAPHRAGARPAAGREPSGERILSTTGPNGRGWNSAFQPLFDVTFRHALGLEVGGKLQ